MFQKFLLSQAINIASLTIAQLIRKYHDQFDIEQTRSKVHEHIRILVKPNFLGEKTVEDKAIAVADWFVDRLCASMESGAEFVAPVLQAIGNGNWSEAVDLVKDFAKQALDISASEGSEGSEQSGEAMLLQAYFEENPDAVPEEESEEKSEPQIKHNHDASGAVNSATDSMVPPEKKLDMQQGQQPPLEKAKPEENAEEQK